MESVVLVIHLILALGIIALVLLQRSEGGGLGIGGGGMGNFASARGTANALTRMTAIFALGFFITSLTLGVMAGGHSKSDKGILEDVKASDFEVQAPVEGSAPGIVYEPPESYSEPAEAEKPTEQKVSVEPKVQEETKAPDVKASEKSVEGEGSKDQGNTAPKTE